MSKGERNGKKWGEKALAFSEVGHFHFISSFHFIAVIINKVHLQATRHANTHPRKQRICQVMTKIGLSCAEFEFEQFTKIEDHLSKD